MASVFGDILTQAKANLDSITYPATTSVLLRKSLTIEQQDTLPLIILAPGQEREIGNQEESEYTVGIDYPIHVGIALNPGLDIDGAEEFNMLTYRELVRRSLRSVNTVLPTSSPCSVVNVSADLSPAFDRPARQDNFDWSAITVTYTVLEPRNT